MTISLFSSLMKSIRRTKSASLMLGLSAGAKLLIVCHCERQDGQIIRIISARRATKRESAFYQGG
ncbi:MAG: BrnT family toxin [Acidovorax sp.]